MFTLSRFTWIAVVASVLLQDKPVDPARQADTRKSTAKQKKTGKKSGKEVGNRSAEHGEPSTDAPGTAVYEVTVGIRITSRGGNRRGFTAGTVALVDWPEQSTELIEKKDIRCKSDISRKGDGGAVLVVTTPPLPPGEQASSIYRYRVTVRPIAKSKSKEDFPADQPRPKRAFTQFLRHSPWIQSNDKDIIKLAQQLAKDKESDWDKLTAFFTWVHKEVKYQQQPFTSVKEAVENRIGDCEEKACIFIAFCRVVGIPARLVWSPGHCWAEFYLVDNEGEGHWLPAHTAGVPWFAHLPATNVILQKGDSFIASNNSKAKRRRLLNDWFRASDPVPAVTFIQEIKPISKSEGPPDPTAPGGSLGQQLDRPEREKRGAPLETPLR